MFQMGALGVGRPPAGRERHLAVHRHQRRVGGAAVVLFQMGVLGVGRPTAGCGRHLAVDWHQRPVRVTGVATDATRMRSGSRRGISVRAAHRKVDAGVAGPLVRVESRVRTAVIRCHDVEIAITMHGVTLRGCGSHAERT